MALANLFHRVMNRRDAVAHPRLLIMCWDDERDHIRCVVAPNGCRANLAVLSEFSCGKFFPLFAGDPESLQRSVQRVNRRTSQKTNAIKTPIPTDQMP